MVRLPPKDGRHSSGQAWFTEDPRSQQQEIFSVSPRFAFRYSCYTRFEACVAVPEGPDDMHAFQIIHQECLGGSSRCNRCARGKCRYGVRSVARCMRAKNQAFHSSLTLQCRPTLTAVRFAALIFFESVLQVKPTLLPVPGG